MKPILKWAGGKSSEIDKIKEVMPNKIERYIEPFLGGGALFFEQENKQSIVNDFNSELIAFYNMINSKDFEEFKTKTSEYDLQRKNVLNVDMTQFSNIEDFISHFSNYYDHPKFQYYFKKEALSKEKTKLKLETNNKQLTIENISDLKITAILAAMYYCKRHDYNTKIQKVKDENTGIDAELVHLWFIMRELAYSGMFRYSKKGDFNVPYGGMSYNKKNIDTKIKHMTSLKELDFYKNAEFNNLDFELFFEKYNYFNENDFIFLDPPYDSEFSQYNKEKDFEKDDQTRLRDVLLKTKANIMVVIKNTPFIYDLYKNDFKISDFDKKYSVNFKNRNIQEVNHLVITNY